MLQLDLDQNEDPKLHEQLDENEVELEPIAQSFLAKQREKGFLQPKGQLLLSDQSE